MGFNSGFKGLNRPVVKVNECMVNYSREVGMSHAAWAETLLKYMHRCNIGTSRNCYMCNAVHLGRWTLVFLVGLSWHVLNMCNIVAGVHWIHTCLRTLTLLMGTSCQPNFVLLVSWSQPTSISKACGFS